MYHKFKRLLDIFFSLLLIPLFIPILIIVGILIYKEDKGPLFYNAKRLGKDGNVFRMFKFRSMKVNAPDIRNDDGSTFNSEKDKRLTKIGSFIRKTSIDELPQIFNVLIGNMSFVGPRPDLPEQYNLYSEIDRKKLKVKPGITGYNQAYFRNTVPWRERLNNDVYYVENLSFLMDFKIIIKTILSVFLRKNVYSND